MRARSAYRCFRAGLIAIFLAILGMLCGVFTSVVGAQDLSPHDRLTQQSKGRLHIEYEAATGAARFVEVYGGKALTHEFVGVGDPEATARAFLTKYGSLFGVTDQSKQMFLRKVVGDTLNQQHVRLVQHDDDIPVFGAELAVHLAADGGVLAVNGYTLPSAYLVNVNKVPIITAEEAGVIAIEYAGQQDGVLVSSELTLFNAGLITSEWSHTYLTYRIRTESPAHPERAQWVFVDAHDGNVRFAFGAVEESRNRNTYNMGHDTSYTAAILARTEDQVPVTSANNCSAADVNNAHDYAGSTYDFYHSRFGRDSYDNAGAALNSYVCYGTNYQNAFWDGTRMTYGDGFAAADDVVAHELSHGVTEYSSNLIYSYQSGALNESYSDIFGESVDLTNGVGTDTSTVRWYVGEDIPGIGAGRNMANPPEFGDPDSTTSKYYFCGSEDYGGVHYNSGVPNKAFYLMVDGGTFNGKTITSIGLDKSLQIEYRANNVYLTTSSKFIDNYNALIRSCSDLYGATANECTQVKNALEAVKMNGPICDTSLPTTSWVSPDNGQTITSRTVRLEANASDDSSGIKEVRFSAKYNGAWNGLAAVTSAPYVFDWDMCAYDVPDGDVELGLEATDNANNKYVYSSDHTNYHINKNYNCSTPPAQVCAAPNLISPSPEQKLTSRTITFSWNPVSGCTFNGYTFRVCTSSEVDTLSNCFIDTGEGSTQRTVTITDHDNMDLWWGVKAANAPNDSTWAIRRFRISPSGQAGQWIVDYFNTRTCWDDHDNCNGTTYNETLYAPGGGTLLDKDYGANSPGGSIQTDYWTGRYEGTFNFATGNYVFYADHDDGLKLNIWNYGEHTKDSSGTNSVICNGTGGFFLSGDMPIRLYLREDGGDAKVRLRWSTDTSVCGSSSGGGVTGGPWSADYFNTRTCWDDHANCNGQTYHETLPFPGADTLIDKNWGQNSPGNGIQVDDWTGRFIGTFNFQPAKYVFYADHDDGLKLTFGGYGEHQKDSSGSNSMICNGTDGYELSGNQQIKLYLREDGGDARVKLWWNTNTTACLPLPSAPTGLWATAGAFSDHVRLGWDPVSYATVYEIWRNYTNDLGTAVQINGYVTATSYDDASIAAGQTYYYWIKAKNSKGTSGFSGSVSGYASLPVQVAPTGVSASDGATWDNVELTWLAVPGAIAYEVWRNTTDSSDTAAHIATVMNGTRYVDLDVTGGQTYYYWVQACNSPGCSGYSEPDSGYALLIPSPTLTSPLNQSSKPASFDLTFEWSPSSGATEYLVEWWGGPYTNRHPCGWSSATMCHVGEVTAANIYSWHVKARSGNNESEWSRTWILATQPEAPAAGYTWVAVPDMSFARYEHTATLLRSGKVLVTGGEDPTLPSPPLVDAAELYDPVSNSWGSAGTMGVPHKQHTATPLPSGEVMVAGGQPFGAGEELYDPASNEWTSWSFNFFSREGHTATLLPSGKVLVVGGTTGGSTTTATAAVYDPAAYEWTPVSSMSTARIRHTATLLPSGKVLVTGGYPDYYPTSTYASAELYDPESNTWTAASNMSTSRGWHAATLLSSGEVLVTGGTFATDTESHFLQSAEIYRPDTDSWRMVSSMMLPRVAHTAVLLPAGKVLQVGGPPGSDLDAEIYDPAADTWESVQSLDVVRSSATATLLPSGSVLVVGGRDDESVAHKSAYLLKPSYTAPSPVNGLSLSSTGGVLTWSHTDSNVAYYRVFRSENPYFTPGQGASEKLEPDVLAPAEGTDVSFADSTMCVGESTSCFYAVVAVSKDGTIYAPSNRVGLFEFPLGPRVSASYPISQDNQDGMEDSYFSISGDGSHNNWVGVSASVMTGWIFPNVTIPNGSTVTRAYVETYGFGIDGSSTTRIYGFAEDNAPVFLEDGSNKPSTRSITAAYVDWSRGWQFAWQSIETPNITNVVQEIVDRAGWSLGNNLGIRVNIPSGTGSNWCSVDYAAGSQRATLHVTYSAP